MAILTYRDSFGGNKTLIDALRDVQMTDLEQSKYENSKI